MMVHLVMVHTVVLRMMQIVIIMMQMQMMIHAVRKVIIISPFCRYPFVVS